MRCIIKKNCAKNPTAQLELEKRVVLENQSSGINEKSSLRFENFRFYLIQFVTTPALKYRLRIDSLKIVSIIFSQKLIRLIFIQCRKMVQKKLTA